MTDVTAGRLHKVIVHPLTVRITHWVNALAMIIMIMSGWRIYNSEPILPFHFPIALTLGGSFDGSVDLHNEDGLAGALQWHFAGMWLLAINGIIYVAYGIFSGPFRRAFFPVGPAAVLRDAIAALRFRLPHRLGAYNAVQKTLYLGVVVAGVIMVLSGLCDLEARTVSGVDVAVRRFRCGARDPLPRHGRDRRVPGRAYCPRHHRSEDAAGHDHRPRQRARSAR